MKKFITKTTVFLLLASVLLSLCACGEAPHAVTTDNRPTVIITEPTSVITTEETTSVSTTEPATEYDEVITPGKPIMSIEPVSKDETAGFLFSRSLDAYYFKWGEKDDEHKIFREKMAGGSVFMVSTMEELNAFHTFLDTACSLFSDYGYAYCNHMREELYGDIAPDFFETSVLVFYIENSGSPCEENSYRADYGDHCVLVNWPNESASIHEGKHYRVGFSCWVVSREALREKELWIRSSRLNYLTYQWIESPYSVNDFAPGELTETELSLVEKCFSLVDDPSLSPAPEGYKLYVDLEGSIAPPFEFEKDETIEPFSGYARSETEFENLLATFESVLNLSELEFSLEKEYFRDYDILYVIGRGGTPESCYYLAQGDTIELHVFPDDSDGLYISFFRVSKNLGEHFNVELIMY